MQVLKHIIVEANLDLILIISMLQVTYFHIFLMMWDAMDQRAIYLTACLGTTVLEF